MKQLVNKTTGRPDLYGHLAKSPSQVRRRFRREWKARYAKEMPAAPTLPWKRSRPAKPKPAPEIDLDAIFGARRDYRFLYPAARKARQTLRGRGLRPSDRDELRSDVQRKRSMRGMRGA